MRKGVRAGAGAGAGASSGASPCNSTGASTSACAYTAAGRGPVHLWPLHELRAGRGRHAPHGRVAREDSVVEHRAVRARYADYLGAARHVVEVAPRVGVEVRELGEAERFRVAVQRDDARELCSVVRVVARAEEEARRRAGAHLHTRVRRERRREVRRDGADADRRRELGQEQAAARRGRQAQGLERAVLECDEGGQGTLGGLCWGLGHLFRFARLKKIGDPHAVLGIARGASLGEARAAYLRLSLALHPDKQQQREREGASAGAGGPDEPGGAAAAAAAAAFLAVQAAWERLRDEDPRVGTSGAPSAPAQPAPGRRAVVAEEIALDELEFDEAARVHVRRCRCGGECAVAEADAAALASEIGRGGAVELECPSCSLVVLVRAAPR